jgi:hypothetical protein
MAAYDRSTGMVSDLGRRFNGISNLRDPAYFMEMDEASRTRTWRLIGYIVTFVAGLMVFVGMPEMARWAHGGAFAQAEAPSTSQATPSPPSVRSQDPCYTAGICVRHGEGIEMNNNKILGKGNCIYSETMKDGHVNGNKCDH